MRPMIIAGITGWTGFCLLYGYRMHLEKAEIENQMLLKLEQLEHLESVETKKFVKIIGMLKNIAAHLKKDATYVNNFKVVVNGMENGDD